MVAPSKSSKLSSLFTCFFKKCLSKDYMHEEKNLCFYLHVVVHWRRSADVIWPNNRPNSALQISKYMSALCCLTGSLCFSRKNISERGFANRLNKFNGCYYLHALGSFTHCCEPANVSDFFGRLCSKRLIKHWSGLLYMHLFKKHSSAVLACNI